VANRFTAHGPAAAQPGLRLSNGSTDVFFDMLTLAGCDLAGTPWEQNLVLYFADGHRIGMGTGGFDLADLPWTANWPAEKQFFLRMIGTALCRHGWDRLRYDPSLAAAQLAAYRDMLASFTPVPSTAPDRPDWDRAPPADRLARCPSHGLYRGELGCRLCDPSIQPT
jgi:hypothetical protein